MKTSLTFILSLAVAVSSLAPFSAGAQIRKYDLGIEDKTIEEGDAIKVVWIAPENRSTAKDWVGIYRRNDSDKAPVAWQYVHDGKEYGYLTFILREEGRYEARMFTNNAYTKVAVESGITVRGDRTDTNRDDSDDDGRGGSRAGYELSFEDTNIELPEQAVVEWEIPSRETGEKHWIGIYERGAADASYTRLTYVSTGQRSGTVSFTLPREGRFEARMFQGDGYERVARSENTLRAEEEEIEFSVRFVTERVSPGTKVTVEYTAPKNRSSTRDWIGIYKRGADDREYYAWQYLPSYTTKGTLTFSMGERGTYEARIFQNDSYNEEEDSDNRLVVR